MKRVLPLILFSGLVVTGCGPNGDSKSPDGPSVSPGDTKAGQLTLSPDNTKIEFVGTHVGPKPDPNARPGGFSKFTGKAEFDPAAKTLKAVSADIETASLWTKDAKLTTHLKSRDFFDVQEHPTAKFVSTKITPGSGGKPTEITGNLTLLGNTKEITFPATVEIGSDGLKLKGSFTIDRTEFGMDKLTDRVEKPVALNITIGEKTEPKKT